MRTNEHSGWEWGEIRRQKLADNRRDNDGRCQVGAYGCLGIATDVHHVVARVDGGGDNDQDLICVCSACHYRFTVETIQVQAAKRRAAKKEAKRRNHPGRKDRHAR